MKSESGSTKWEGWKGWARVDVTNNNNTIQDSIHTLSTILHNCVASSSCCLFEIKGSITKCSFISA
jgi:hypothetical protein